MASLEKYLFYLLVFSLPFQTRLILFQWGSSSSFGTSGGFNEYQAAFFYFTDFLIALIFISCLWRSIRTGSFGWRSIFASHSDFLLAAFVIIAGVSLYWANNFGLGIYQFLKLVEFVWLFFYIKNNFAVLNFSHALWFLFSSAVFQALLADWQWHNQSSIGLKLLGESVLDPNLAGVAKLDIPNAKLIRPYGTFPHPNILAAFLSAAIFIFYWLYLSNKKPYGRIQISEWLKFLAFFILLLGLFLTFSRLIIITFILAGVIFFWLSKRLGKDDLIFKQRRQVLLYLSAIFTFIFLFLMRPEMFGRFGQLSLAEQSVSLRWLYNEIAALMIANNPLTGVGFGNFTNRMAEFLPYGTSLESWAIQPVHNIYLLIAAETGVIGLFFFLWFLISIVIKTIGSLRLNFTLERLTLLLITLAFLFIGLFDHFFLTLQQGHLMLWIILALLTVASAHSTTDSTQASEA